MRFGLLVPTFSWPDLDYGTAGRIREFARRAETLGFDSLWVAEHLLTAPGLYGVAWLAPLECLALMAGVTERIRLGTNILILALRNPVMTAKAIATLDVLSGGRFILGVGVGWDAREFEVMGVPMAERGGRTDEALAVIRRLLTERRVSHHGRHYRVEDVTVEPLPPRMVPVWIAGGSKVKTALSPDPAEMHPGVLRRILRHDGWTARAAGTQETVKADWARIRAALAAEGRTPGDLVFSHLNFFHLVDTGDREAAWHLQRGPFERVMGTHRPWELLRECYVTGTTGDVVARLRDLQAAGLQHAVMGPVTYDLDQLERFAGEVMPHFRGA